MKCVASARCPNIALLSRPARAQAPSVQIADSVDNHEGDEMPRISCEIQIFVQPHEQSRVSGLYTIQSTARP